MKEKVCPNCGETLKPDQVFCPGCGKKYEPPKRCNNCGAELEQKHQFCPYCGAKVEGDSENTAPKKDDSNSVSEPSVTAAQNLSNKKAVRTFAVLIAVVLLAVAIKLISSGASDFIKTHQPFVGTEDITVLLTTIYRDNHPTAIVKNNSDKTIRDYTLAYIPYDSSGNPLVDSFTSEYIHYITFKSANILPGDTFGYKNSFYSSAGYDVYFYIDATVSSITYMDDTIWNAKGIDSWAKDAINNFSVDKARQTVESYKDYSNKAVDNGYLQYAYTMVDDDIAFELLNSSRKTITGIELLVLLYDSNGYSVDTFSDFMVDNCFSYKETASLAPGDTHFLTTSYLPRYNAKYCNSIIFSLDFSDGTHWTNPYTGYWIKYNENMR